jgi:hypothetical protein
MAWEPIAGLADDGQIGVLEQTAQCGAHGGAVVDDQNARRLGELAYPDGLPGRRVMMTGRVLGSWPAQRRQVDRVGAVIGARDSEEVDTQQQGGDSPVELYGVASSRGTWAGVQI